MRFFTSEKGFFYSFNDQVNRRVLRPPKDSRRTGVRLNAPLGRSLANEQVQFAHVETCLAIVLSSQLKRAESILLRRNTPVDWLVQIDEATFDDKHDQCWFR